MSSEWAAAGVGAVLTANACPAIRMMASAAITAHTTQVRSGDSELARITGARVPTGIQAVVPALVPARTRYPSTAANRHRTRPPYSGSTNQAKRPTEPRRSMTAA